MLTRLTGALLLVCVMAGPVAAEQCRASYYGAGERLNRHTANGEVFNRHAMTAAHRTLPFGTKLRVTYRGRSVVVRISDRGPHHRTGRCLDLSYGAAKALGMVRAGVARVHIQRIN